MTACTERQTPQPAFGAAREGQKGIAKGGRAMTACTERQTPQPAFGAAREGQKGIAKGAER